MRAAPVAGCFALAFSGRGRLEAWRLLPVAATRPTVPCTRSATQTLPAHTRAAPIHRWRRRLPLQAVTELPV
eukprot:4755374-Alexandrium_andersonii.AAC.1